MIEKFTNIFSYALSIMNSTESPVDVVISKIRSSDKVIRKDSIYLIVTDMNETYKIRVSNDRDIIMCMKADQLVFALGQKDKVELILQLLDERVA